MLTGDEFGSSALSEQWRVWFRDNWLRTNERVVLTPGATVGNLVQIVDDNTLEDAGIAASDVLEPSDISGTANQITVTDDGDGTITLSTPQNIDTDADMVVDTLTADDLITGGITVSDLTDGWPIEPVSGVLTSFFGHKIKTESVAADKVLDIATDMRKIWIVDATAASRRITLPSAAADYVGEWVTLARIGGNWLIINRSGADMVVSTGGTRIDNKESRYMSLITLFIVSSGVWMIGRHNFGIWTVR